MIRSNWRSLLEWLALGIIIVALAAAPIDAQALYGTLTGAITDAQGGAVPGVTVTARHEQTGLEVSAITDATGTYTLRNIAGGIYTLKASLQGFKEFVQTGIPVVVGNIVRINGKLESGALTESVTVTSEAPLLKTDQADVSTDLPRKRSSTCR